MSFRGKFGGSLGRQRVEEAESWARIELFELAAADERLVDAPAPASASVPSPVPSFDAPPATPVGAPPSVDSPVLGGGSVELRVLGVALEPLRVVPGSEVGLVVTYTIEGLEPARTVEVVERRSILQAGETLTTLEARLLRGAGTHRSSQPLSVPTSLTPGILTFEGSAQVGDSVSRAETPFQVASP